MDIEKKEKKKIIYALSLITQVGLSMLVPILLCVFTGIWITKYVHNDLVILFTSILGIIVAFRNVYILVKSMYSKDKENEDAIYEYYKEMEKERIERLGK